MRQEWEKEDYGVVRGTWRGRGGVRGVVRPTLFWENFLKDLTLKDDPSFSASYLRPWKRSEEENEERSRHNQEGRSKELGKSKP